MNISEQIAAMEQRKASSFDGYIYLFHVQYPEWNERMEYIRFMFEMHMKYPDEIGLELERN